MQSIRLDRSAEPWWFGMLWRDMLKEARKCVSVDVLNIDAFRGGFKGRRLRNLEAYDRLWVFFCVYGSYSRQQEI